MNNNEEIKQLRKEYNLSNARIAKFLGMKRDSVNKWFLSSDSKGFRKCPTIKLELLKILVKKGNITHWRF